MRTFEGCHKNFLLDVTTQKPTISIYLKNGLKITGKLIGETEDMIFLNLPASKIIYKNRVSAIISELNESIN